MEVRFLPLWRAHEATGTVVVVDVLRAFTTAACAVDQGVVSIRLVREVEEAIGLRTRGIVDLVLGEVDGLPVEGFDLSNSPADLTDRDLTGARLAMRTSAGTQGAVLAEGATRLVTGAFVNARATADALRDAHTVTFVLTGVSDGREGDEDRALAEYVSAMLEGACPDPAPFLARVRSSDHGRRFGADLPFQDVVLACDVDRYGRALEINREKDGLVIRA